MKLVGVILTVAIMVSACTRDEALPPVNPDLAEAAFDLCPVLWQWQLEIGGTMNDMSRSAFDEPSASRRLRIYLKAMDAAHESITVLRTRLAHLPAGRYQHFFRNEVEDGLDQAELAIDQTEADIGDLYDEYQEPTYHQVVPSVFLSFEKVIDLAKPELASYGDPELIPAFQTVAQCQHGVKDADDGVPRYVPLQPQPTG